MNNKSLLKAFGILLIFSSTNSMFLKSKEEIQMDDNRIILPPNNVEKEIVLPLNLHVDRKDNLLPLKEEETEGYKEKLSNLQEAIGSKINDLGKQIEDQKIKIEELRKPEEVKETIPTISKKEVPSVAPVAPKEKENIIKGPNLLQMEDDNDPISKLKGLLNLKVGAPTISNSIATTDSTAKSIANDKSISKSETTVQSNTNSDASGDKNAIAVSNASGNSESKSNTNANDSSAATTVINNVNNGNSIAKGSENSLAVSNTKSNSLSDTNTIADKKSESLGSVAVNTAGDSITNVVKGSVGSSNALTDEKTITSTLAVNNSTSLGQAEVNSAANSNVHSENQSLSQSVAESKNTANTTTTAHDNSASQGSTTINSSGNSTATAVDGGNTISTAHAENLVNTVSAANLGSVSNATNTGGSNSNSISTSVGTNPLFVNPQEVSIATISAVPNTITTPSQPRSEPAPVSAEPLAPIPPIITPPAVEAQTTPSTPNIAATKNRPTPVLSAGEDKKTIEVEKPNVFADNIKDKIAALKENCPSMDEAKKTVLKAVDESGKKDEKLIVKAEPKEKEEEKIQEEEKSRKEDRKEEKKKKKDKKHRHKKRHHDDHCEEKYMVPSYLRNKKMENDFQEGVKEMNFENDPRFCEERMSRDNIKEFDVRKGDNDNAKKECIQICGDENLGELNDYEIQDLMGDRKLIRCQCKKGTTDWFLFDGKETSDKDMEKDLTQSIYSKMGKKYGEEDYCEPNQEAAHPLNISSMDDEEERHVDKKYPEEVAKINVPAQPSLQANKVEESDEDEEDDDEFDDDIPCDITRKKRKRTHYTEEDSHNDLGDCFNHFIENKFKKLHNRLNKLKRKNCNYIKNLHKKQMHKQAEKVDNIVDKNNETGKVNELAKGGECYDPLKGHENLENIQDNLKAIKNKELGKQVNVEDNYFNQRNEKDNKKFNDRMMKRFDEKKKCEDNRFSDRFENTNRYAGRDEPEKKCSMKPDSDNFIATEVGRIKNQNKNYLSKIKSMFSGGEDKIDSE